MEDDLGENQSYCLKVHLTTQACMLKNMEDERGFKPKCQNPDDGSLAVSAPVWPLHDWWTAKLITGEETEQNSSCGVDSLAGRAAILRALLGDCYIIGS